MYCEPVIAGPDAGGGGAFSGLIETNVEDAMKGINASMFVRMPFTVTDPAQVESLTLRMKYNDGYVAYLNGQKIGGKNAPAVPLWNSNATGERTDTQARTWENTGVTDPSGMLVAGQNVLAIHALNYATGDGDFLVLPELVEVAYLGLGEHFFATDTPAGANTAEFWLYVEDVEFSHARGFHEEAFSLTLSTATAGAEIYYTTDGPDPLMPDGTVNPLATLYTGAIPVTTTTAVRATAVKAHHAAPASVTHTYLFLDDVLRQPSNPDGFPSMWNGIVANYEVDPDVVNHPDYSATIKGDMQAIPSLSIVTDVEDMFGTNGIYANPGARGDAWERASSVEWINTDGTTGFQLNAGVRIVGGASRGAGNKKHSFRLTFKSEFGPTKLQFDMFGEGAVDEFDTITLRAGFNDRWTNGSSTYLQDRWTAERQLATGGLASHGTFVHLYVNGLYWGLYNPIERPDDSFAASYLGGDKEDYDAYNIEGLNSGNRAAWDQLNSLINNPTSNYAAIEGMLDIPAFCDYLIVNQYGGNWDWPQNNWWATYDRTGDGKWRFHSWDAEGCLRDVNGNRVDQHGSALGNIYWKLREVEAFRVVFADHVHKLLFNGGPLSLEANIAWLDAAEERLYRGIVGESARWGDGYADSDSPRTRDGHWVPRINWLRNTYFPARSSLTSGQNTSVLQQYKNAGLYPNVDAPSFAVNGSYQHGGMIDFGDVLTISASAGTSIYYTTDGSDPRPAGGGAPDAGEAYGGAITLNEGAHVKARAYNAAAGKWSALNEATFYIDLAPDIRISEIMYNPSDPTPAEIAAGFDDSDDFEFLEIKNISATKPLALAGLRLTNGIDFTFGEVSVPAGQYVVVVSNRAAFEFRYSGFPGTIAGEYGSGLVDGTKLSNSGEKIQLDSPVGGTIHEFSYRDGWYDHTDGDGFSLTIRDPDGAPELWDLAEGWRASAAPGGSPGNGDVLADPASVIINEVLAHSDSTMYDAIELHNTSDSPVDISGWFLSDARKDDLGNETLTKYQIPVMAPLAPDDYVVFYENTSFGTGGGAFALSELGDDVYLSSNASGVAGGYREHVSFGASPADVSFGLYTKSTGGTDFTLLGARTLGSANAFALHDDIVINEIMYHAAEPTPDEIAAGHVNDSAFEFIELYNSSATNTRMLSDFHLSGGVGFTFGWYDADGLGRESWTLEAGATATWNATLPAGATSYEVFARWDLLDGEGDARDLDGQARYTITHSGGTTEVIRDQKPEDDDEGPDYIDAEGWVSLGTYTFDDAGQVVLTRGTNDPGNWTIADQVKFVGASHTEVVDNPSLDSWYTANGAATIAPGGYAVIVSDLAAFDMRYDIAGNGIPVAGQYTGNLSNNGEKVKLMRRGNPEPAPSYFIPYYRVDYVNYDDTPPWPVEADRGCALNRLRGAPGELYGNDLASWHDGAYRGTPGAANASIDVTPPTTPTGLSAYVAVAPGTQIELTWTAATDSESHVDHYVIYRDGEPIGTSRTLGFADTDVTPMTPYSYAVSAVNRDQYEGDTSSVLAITIPGARSLALPNSTSIRLVFTEALLQFSAEIVANYTFSGGAVSAAVLEDPTTVLLTVPQFQIGQTYTLTVADVQTVSGLLMPPGREFTFEYHFVGASILREFWTGITGSAVTDLTSNANYPDSPTRRNYPTLFEAPVNTGDEYGTRMRGYVHPPESGFYTFWIASDDSSELYLSTDGEAANATKIAYVSGAVGYRSWTTRTSQKSVEIYLSQGLRYYIEAIQKEGGSGDHLSVAWQRTGGAFEGPIPATYLSPFVLDALDHTVPSTPTNVAAHPVNSGAIDLTWTAAGDSQSGVAYYVVYRNDKEIGTTPSTRYSDTGLGQTQTYTYSVAAVNGDDFEGARGAAIPASPSPGITAVSAIDASHVRVTFGKNVTEATAEAAGNYTVTDSAGAALGVLSAVWGPSSRVTLTLTEPLAENVIYTVSAQAVKDAAGTPVEPNAAMQLVYGNLDADLLAWWTFDVNNEIVANDLTANNRDLTVNGAQWVPAGRIGGAYRFDGSAGDFLVNENPESFINGLGAFTFAAWIKADSIGTDRGLYYLRDPNGNDEYGFRHDAALQSQSNRPNGFRGGISTTGGTQRWESVANVQTTEWQHVAVTWASGQDIRMYLDGVPVATGWRDSTRSGTIRSCERLIIGRGTHDQNASWQGLIDDVRIYGSALSQARITTLIDPRPVVQQDDYDVNQGAMLTVVGNGVLANDFDPDPGPAPLTVELIDDVDHGELTLNRNGSFSYTPAGGYIGPDNFTYRAFDGEDYSDAATVNLTVLPAVRVTSVEVPDRTHVELQFSSSLDAASAQAAGNYVVAGGPTVASASLAPDLRTVTLTLASAMNDNQVYTLTISNVADHGHTHVIPPNTPETFAHITWLGRDIGAVAAAGTNSEAGGVWTIEGSGRDIWDNDDEFHFVYQTFTGDFTVTARLASIENTDGWAKSGVMVRQSLDANSVNAFALISPTNGASFHRRKITAQQTAQTQVGGIVAPHWVRLVREGDTFTAYRSANGSTWTAIASDTVVMPQPTVYVGMAVTSHNDGTLCTTVFDNVSIVEADYEPPTADIIDIDPDPRGEPVSDVHIFFGEAVTGLDVTDLTLTRDGGANLLDGSQQVSTVNGMAWTLSGLTDVTGAPGTYTLTLHAAGSRIKDAAGNLLAGDASDNWLMVLAGPIPDVVNVSPDPRNSPVAEVRIVFSEAVTGFDVGDLALRRNTVAIPLGASQSLTTADNATWTLEGLAGLTAEGGTYVLELTGADSGIENAAAEPLMINASDTWTTDTQAPVGTVGGVDPDPRDMALGSVDIVFDQPVTGLDVSDLVLTRDGGENLLTGTETLRTQDNITWTLAPLTALTASTVLSGGFVAFNDQVIGAATHANTTTYGADGTPTGLLKDIATGQATPVTLAITQSGVNFAGAGAEPTVGTDAYNVFNGYVDFRGAGGASLEINAVSNDHYTHTFSGLDTGSVVTYSFHGTAIRGNVDYTNRWTLVTLNGAEAFTPDHSSGVGVVTAALNANQVAIWVGHNSAAGQGFVAGWRDIDPGPDGKFTIVSNQYTGPTPGVGTGTANGTKGYGIAGVRLEEFAPSGAEGVYTLTVTASGSGIRDSVGNVMTADVAGTFVIDTSAPTVDIVDVSPDPHGSPVDEMQIVFNEKVTGLTVPDLGLSRDGGANLLTGANSLTSTDAMTWTLGGLSALTTPAGTYTLALTASGSGIKNLTGYGLADDASETWVRMLTSSRTGRPDLLSSHDTGASDGDNLTAYDNGSPDRKLRFQVDGTILGATVTIHVDTMIIGSAVADGPTTTVTTDGLAEHDLADGRHSIIAMQTEAGKLRSNRSQRLYITVDTAAPRVEALGLAGTADGWTLGTVDSSLWMTGRSSQTVPWSAIDQVVVNFSEPVLADAGDMTLTGVTSGVINPTALVGSGTDQAIYTLGAPLDTDRRTMALATDVADVAGNALVGPWTADLNVVIGDINGDGRVSSRDRRDLRGAYGSAAGGAAYAALADLSADGRVSSRDRRILRDNYGTALPDPSAAPAPAPAAAGTPSAGDTDSGDLVAAAALVASSAGTSLTTPIAQIDGAAPPAPAAPVTNVQASSLDVSFVASPVETASPSAVPPAVSTDADIPSASKLELDLSSGLTDPLE